MSHDALERLPPDGRAPEEDALALCHEVLSCAPPGELSSACDAVIAWILADWSARLTPRYGHPEGGARLAVIGLGPLGEEALEPDEPLDLVFVFDGEGADAETVGGYGLGRRLAAREWYRLLVDALCGSLTQLGAGLADPTLRAWGARLHEVGALADAYERAGHGWERLIWASARPVAGELALGARAIGALMPFVYPKALADDDVDEIAAIKARIAARTGGAQSRDALRERLRFVVRALQTLFGGRYPAVRGRDLSAALDALATAGALPEADAGALRSAWAEVAAGPPGDASRQAVADAFDALFPDAPGVSTGAVGIALDASLGEGERRAVLAELGFVDAAAAAHRVTRMMRRLASPFHPRRLLRDDRTAWALLQGVASSPDPDGALAHLEALLSKRNAALGAVAGDPARLRALTRLFGTSGRMSRHLIQQADTFDRLLVAATEPRLKSPALMARDAARSPIQLRQREHLRLALFEITGALEPHEVAAQATSVADALVRSLLPAGEPGAGWLGLVALGRYGERTLSYQTGLTLAFVYEGEAAAHVAAATEVVRELTTPKPDGTLYELAARAEVWTVGRLEALVSEGAPVLSGARVVAGPDALHEVLAELPAPAPTPIARDAPLWDGRYDLRRGLQPWLEARAALAGAEPDADLVDHLVWFRQLENALGILHDTPVGALPTAEARRRAAIARALMAGPADAQAARARHAALRERLGANTG